MEVKPGYKQTEVGVIPEDWGVISAFDACSKIQDGTHFSPRIGGSGYLYVTSKNIRFGHLDMSTASWIDAAQHQAIYRRCDVKKGDLLLTKDGANTGNAALNNLDEEFSLLSSVAFLRFNPSKHCAGYFLQQVLTSQGQRQIQDAMAGNAITRLTLEKINKLRFPTPPTKPEQEAIAEALSDADALIESMEQLLAKKRHLKQGAMQELLTGKKRLPGFSGEWEVKRLDELGRWTGGMTPSMRNPAFWQAGTVPWISSGDVKSARLIGTASAISEYAVKQRTTTMLPTGSIIVVTRSGILRKFLPVAMNMIPMAINQDIKALLPNCHVLPDYVLHSLAYNGDRILARCLKSGTTVESVEFPWLKAFTIPIPPLPEQTAIAAILSDMDTEITTLEAKLYKTRQIKQGMMQELLTGRIRLA
ncbi:MAG: restriction endonuclease subunit S [Candidatus Eisenbacteria bacterium]|uniref:Restriction endonuclease subunit S n=1 Tax=Eiseniibacteriota bacterium TaxID=2212470 RepID=A0A948WD29_UNCEI|nr:restriction endonuclease subunit S [Candidatus Eisenbacteria bacterium]MBU2691463.1 restriction endonuclease subunit S [Candidatus Eisenbacteria bacterium]